MWHEDVRSQLGNTSVQHCLGHRVPPLLVTELNCEVLQGVKHFGVLNRHRYGIQPTPVGRFVLKEARHVDEIRTH